MSGEKRQIKLGVSMRGYGYHASAWRHPDVPTGALLTFEHFRNIVKTAERGLFDMAFLADYVAVGRRRGSTGVFGRDSTMLDLEPITLLGALSPATRHIGLVATTSASFQAPYHIARMYASLDHLSGGRAGWNVVTSGQDDEARNFGQDMMLDKNARYARAREAVQTVLGLWDSWDDDAFVRDKQSGRYFDPDKMHPLDHDGEYFKVAGPLNIPRTPQGRPVVVQAGSSDQGQDLAAETADVVYAAYNQLSDAQAFYTSLKGRMAGHGRHPDDLKIMPGILPIIGETAQEAQAKYEEMKETIDPIVGMGTLTAMFGDLSGCDIDGPLPDEAEKHAWRSSRIQIFFDLAKRNNLSLRQLYQQALIGNAHNVVIGTPAMVADVMEEWFVERGADGFNVLPAYTPFSFTAFVDKVMPELQRRGLTRLRYEGETMRENMGLPWPTRAAR